MKADHGKSMGLTSTQKALAALLFASSVLNYLDRSALSVVSPIMRRDLHLSTSDYAFAVNGFLIAYGVMYAGSGLLLDRIGFRTGLALFVGVWSVASGLHAATAGLASLTTFRVLLGLAEPGGFTGAVKTVASSFNSVQRPLATGIFTAGSGLGSLIAPPLIVFLSFRAGWRAAFLIPACAGLLWVPLWLRTSGKTAVAKAPSSGAGAVQSHRDWRDPRIAAYILARFFGDSSGYFFMFWMPEYLVASKHFTMRMVGALAWIPPCFSDLGALLGGYVSGRLVQSGLQAVTARKVLMTVAAAMVLIGTLLQSASQVSTTMAALSICTFGVGVWASNLHSLPADAFGPHSAATVHGIAGSAGALGGIFFNHAVGRLTGHGDYPAAFLLLALLQPLGLAALWLWMKREAGT